MLFTNLTLEHIACTDEGNAVSSLSAPPAGGFGRQVQHDCKSV